MSEERGEHPRGLSFPRPSLKGESFQLEVSVHPILGRVTLGVGLTWE